MKKLRMNINAPFLLYDLSIRHMLLLLQQKLKLLAIHQVLLPCFYSSSLLFSVVLISIIATIMSNIKPIPLPIKSSILICPLIIVPRITIDSKYSAILVSTSAVNLRVVLPNFIMFNISYLKIFVNKIKTKKILGVNFNKPLAEKKVADFVLKCPDRIINLSITSLAKESKVSIATITRFVNLLGFKSFPEMKIKVAQDLISPFQNIHEDIKL